MVTWLPNHDNEQVIRIFIVTLSETPGIGWASVNKVLMSGMSLKETITADKLIRLGIRAQPAEEFCRRWTGNIKPAWEDALAGQGGWRLTPLDSEYPELLRQIPQPPWVLYGIGDRRLLSTPCLSVVGTRNPSVYGRQAASALAGGIARQGFTIVSGMAKGIDGIVHQAALDAGCGTIAVLGTPVDTAYPPENRPLYRRIARDGMLLSEYPIGTPVHPGMFPQRNRIIAGLSLGTVVVEAASRSGSLITAEQALEMNRDVFAVPGPLGSTRSEGCNELIRCGYARLLSDARQIGEEYPDSCRRMPEPEREGAALTAEEEAVLRLLQDGPRTADGLLEALNMPFGLLQAVLINLSLKHKIEQQSGSIYMAL